MGDEILDDLDLEDETLLGEPDGYIKKTAEDTTGVFTQPQVSPAQDSSFDDIFDEVEQEQADLDQHAFDGSIALSIGSNPDRQIKNQQIADKLKEPVELVETDPEGAETALTVQETNTAVENSPKLKERLRQLGISSKMKLPDDATNLSCWETVWKDVQNRFDENRIIREKGLRVYNQDNLNEKERQANKLRLEEIDLVLEGYHQNDDIWGPSGPLGEASAIIGIMVDGIDEIIAKAIAGGTGAATAALVGGQIGPQALVPEEVLTVPGAFIAGAGIAATAEVFDQTRRLEAGFAREEFEKAGFDPAQAKATAEIVGWVNGTLEILALGQVSKIAKVAIIKAIGKKARFGTVSKYQALGLGLLTLLKIGGTEGLVEVVQDVNKATQRELGRHINNSSLGLEPVPDADKVKGQFQTLADVTDFAGEEAKTFLKVFSGAALLGTPVGVTRIVAERRKIAEANLNEEVMAELGKNAQESILGENLPQVYQSMVQELAKDGPITDVYVKAEEINKHYKEESAPLMEQLGILKEYELARETGDLVKIPLPAYIANIARDVEAHKAFSPHVSFTEDGVTATEAQQMQDALDGTDDQGATALRSHLQQQEDATVKDKIRRGMKDQLVAAGETEDSAAAQAEVRAINLETSAQAFGMSLERFNKLFAFPLVVEPIKNPLILTPEEAKGFRIDTADLRAKGHDSLRILADPELAKTNPRFKNDQNIGIGRLERLMKESKKVGNQETLNQASATLQKTPEFQKFFAESSVVDESGNPVMLFHSTLAPEIKGFRVNAENELGAHFGTSDQANNRIGAKKEGRTVLGLGFGSGKPMGENVIPVFLNIKNSLRMPDVGDFSNFAQVLDGLMDSDLTDQQVDEVIALVDDAPSGANEMEIIKDFIGEQGFDGVVYSNENEGYGDSYIAFKQEQIKSVFNQNPTDSPDTLYQAASLELIDEGLDTDLNPNWYFSTLSTAVHSIPKSKTANKSGQEWLNIIGKLAGVKKEEIAFTGLDNFLLLDRKLHDMEQATGDVRLAQGRLDRAKDFRSIEIGPEEPIRVMKREAQIRSREDALAGAEADLRAIGTAKKRKISHAEIQDYLANNGVRVVDISNGAGQEFDRELHDEEIGELAQEYEERKIGEHMDGVQTDIADQQIGDVMDDWVKNRITELEQEAMDSGISPDDLNGRDIAAQAETEAAEDRQEIWDELYQEAHSDAWDILASDENLMREAWNEATDEIEDRYSESGETKFGDYTLDGGQNYTELLLTYPDFDKQYSEDLRMVLDIRRKIIAWAEEMTGDQGGASNQVYSRVRDGFMQEFNEDVDGVAFNESELKFYKTNFSTYFSTQGNGVFSYNKPAAFVNDSHFSAPSIIAHIRYKERTGGRIPFTPEDIKAIDEGNVASKEEDAARQPIIIKESNIENELSVLETKIQREYRLGLRGDALANERARVDKLKAELAIVRQELSDLRVAQSPAVTARNTAEAIRNNPPKVLFVEEFQSDWGTAIRNKDTIVSGPFVNDTQDWTALALKRMIDLAIKGGFDRVEWANGAQSSEHYNMAKRLTGIVWNPVTKILSVRRHGEESFQHAASNVEANDLPEYMGANLAAKLLESEGFSGATIERFSKARTKLEDAQKEYSRLKKQRDDAYDVRFPPERPEGGYAVSDVLAYQDYVQAREAALGLLAEAKEKIRQFGARTGMPFDSSTRRNLQITEARRQERVEELDAIIATLEKTDPTIKAYVEGEDKLIAEMEAVEKTRVAASKEVDELEASFGGESSSIAEGDKFISGGDMEVSNKEQSAYYDKILPDIAKKVLKKLGVKSPKMENAGRALQPKVEIDAYTPGEQPGFGVQQIREALADNEGKIGRIALFQKKRDEEANRGALIFGPDISKDDNILQLLEGSDLSTYLHETGHFFFEQLRFLSNHPEAPTQIKEDMKTLLSFVGVDSLATWNAMTPELRRAGHEKVAESWEKYLFEGKAPTAELRVLFRRFSAWLKQIYKNIKRLNVTLTPEVRGVFDRMLATEAQIQESRQSNRMTPLFENNDVIQMSDSQWENYMNLNSADVDSADESLRKKSLANMRWLRSATNQFMLEKKREVRSQREAVKVEVEKEVADRREYTLISWLRTPVEKKTKIKSHRTDVTPEVDNLFLAIGKLGGIHKLVLESAWGIDVQHNYGRYKPAGKAKGGKSIDAIGLALLELGYLKETEKGQYDPVELEDKFFDELSGRKHFSNRNEQFEASESYENEYLKYSHDSGEAFTGLEQIPHAKISMESLRREFGDEADAIWKALPVGKWGVMSEAETSMDVKLVADFAGYGSVDEMIHKIVQAKPMRQEIEDRTDDRMIELFGDLQDKASVDKSVDEALHNEARTRAIHAELTALSRRVGKVNLLASAAREIAETQISGMRIIDIIPSKFAAGEARANRAAEQALRKGNLAEATDHKKAAILQHHFAKVAAKAIVEVDKDIRFFNRIDSKGSRKAIHPEYSVEIDKLLGNYDIRRSTTIKAMERAETLFQWVQSEIAKGNNPDVDPRFLGEIRPKHFREVPLEEFRGLYDTVAHIAHLGRLKEKLLTDQEKRKVEEVVGEIVTEAMKHGSDQKKRKGKGRSLGDNNPQDKGRKENAGFFAEHRKFANMGRVFDGVKDDGPFWHGVTKVMNKQADWQADMQEKASIKLTELFSVFSASEFSHRFGKKENRLYWKQHIPEIDVNMSRMEMIMVGMNWGNLENRQRVTEGHKLSESQVQDHILSRLRDKDWMFIQSIWDYYQEFWPLIEAKERRVSGIAPEKVEHLPFKTLSGIEMTGGYHPITYDQDQSSTIFDNLAAEAAQDAKMGAVTRATTKRNHTKARSEGDPEMPVRLEFNLIFEHIQTVIHDLAWHEWLIDSNKILGHKDFKDMVLARYGSSTLAAIKNTVTDIARGNIEATKATERRMNYFRQGMSIMAMGYNAGTAILQPLGITQGLVRLGEGGASAGLRVIGRLFTSGTSLQDTYKEILEVSTFMRLRSKTMNREINEIRNKISRVGMLSKQKGWLDDSYFWMIAKSQMIADIPIWLAARELAESKHNMSPADAVAFADTAVIDSQGSGHIKDLADVQRGSPAKQLWTNFMSYFQTTYNLSTDSIKGTNFKDPRSVGRLATDFMLLYTIPIIMEEYVRGALLKGECRDGADWKCMIDKIARDHLTYPMSGILYVRELASVVTGFDYSGPAGSQIFKYLADLGQQTGQLVDESGFRQDQLDSSFWKAANKAGGVALHYPAVATERFITGFLDLQSGKTDKKTAPLFGYSKR